MNLEELRRKKLEEYLSNANMQNSQENVSLSQLMEIQNEIKKAMGKILDGKARERLANIKMVKPEFALQIELYLIQLYKAGQLRIPVNDNQLKGLLDQIVKKPDWKIKYVTK